MIRLQTIAQVEHALEPYVAVANETIGREMTTDRTKRLARLVGNPHDELKVLHIAGTSGKTSTCYYAADLLRRAGQKVGMTVSPHMKSITERVQINGIPLPEEKFCEYFSEFIQLVEVAPETPTNFELMMVFAYWVFQKEQVDYAVIETGLGGLHDSSNVAVRADKVCILADIGRDHMHVLGRSIEEITRQKVGIVHRHNLLVMHEQSPEIMSVVRQHVSECQATLVSENDASETFQQRNWSLAYRAYEQLRIRDGLGELSDEELEQSRTLHVPGRMDIFKSGGKTIVLDGAHNEQKISAFLTALEHKFPAKKFPMMIALKRGKELERITPLLAPYASSMIATELQGPKDAPIRSIDAHEIANAFQSTLENVRIEQDIKRALRVLLVAPEDVVVVTGSLYLVADVRKLLQITS